MKNIIKGFANVLTGNNKALSKERIVICKACDKRDGELCGICGCYLPAKTSVKEEVCPAGKWN